MVNEIMLICFFCIFRVLTYTYVYACNAWLLLNPSMLSYDWQMNSIPMVMTWTDPRNLATIVFLFVTFVLVFNSMFKSQVILKHPDLMLSIYPCTCIKEKGLRNKESS